MTVAVQWLILSYTSGNDHILALTPVRGRCQFHARAVERALEQMGKGKSCPGVQSPRPAQHLCSQQHCRHPQHCPSTGGVPRKGHFFVYFQEKCHSLPAEELKCRNGCSQHSPPVAHVGAAPCVCLSVLPTNGAAAKGAWTGGSEQGQAGTLNPLLALPAHTAPHFPCGFTEPLCHPAGTWVQQNWDRSRGAPAGLGELSATSQPAWLGNSLPRQRNPHFSTHRAAFCF